MPDAPPSRVLILGAGPAGLTTADLLLEQTATLPVLIETESQVGGLSRTVSFNGNRMDIGGHRFFSKSDWVMDYWRRTLPTLPLGAILPERRDVGSAPGPGPSHEATPKVLLTRPRLSRIFYLKRFFDYPVRMNLNTALNLGPVRLVRTLFSYVRVRLFPIREERSLQDFVINRFGRELFRTFFKDYTEKVWGIPCDQISAEWGAQRIKGLSISKAILHALSALLPGRPTDVSQKSVATSLIEQFLYPAFGPGQMWEEVSLRIVRAGGELRLRHSVVRIHREGDRITGITIRNEASGAETHLAADACFSSIPIRDFVLALDPPAPAHVVEAAKGLEYRDFITVGLLLKELKASRHTPEGSPQNLLPDTWIYIQEPEVKLGRLQIFNNWSPYLVRQSDRVWIGLEYFCQEGDALWNLSDEAMGDLATRELAQIGLASPEHVLEAHVVRVKKAYPAYFGGYARFPEIRAFLDGIRNLYSIGRNGLHRYNNQDHSMLSAKEAVAAYASGAQDRSAIWNVNVGDDYHEEVRGASTKTAGAG